MKIQRILIPATDFVENHTIYYLEVYIREYSWIVTRRYKEFYELHDKLVKKHGVEYSLLPPKKYFGSLKPEYVERRRQALESYLEMLLSRFEDLPDEILEFLQASRYDVCGVTHALANELFVAGDKMLAQEEQFTVTPLQLHCITCRLGMAVPTCDSHSAHGEIGNLYDFIYQLKHLKVSGGEKQVELGDNITLKCNLSIFKSLETLEISYCDIEPFEGLNFVQNHANKLVVHRSIHLLKDILVDDEIWEQGVLENVDENGVASLNPNSNFRAWNLLTEADFSENDIPYIDESVALLPNITRLNLSHNCIDSIDHLQALSNLVDLDLSHNAISNLGSNLNTKLGNVKRLNLAKNHFENVEGLDKFYSLVTLDLSENRLSDVGSVITLGELPCLEVLDLRGNGLVKSAMYRVRIFTAFEERAEQLQLDGHRPSTREMNRIRELLEEEENFEIINFPTPPHHIKPKHGHKKGKTIDRLITLDPGDNIQSSVSSTDSSSVVDDTDAEFRSRVEKIRQLGGDSWLRIFDEMQGEEEMAQLLVPVKEEPPGSTSNIESTRDHPSSKMDTVSEGDTSLTGQEEETRTLRAHSEIDTVDKETMVTVGENGSDPCRLHFGFAPDLEELLHEIMESNAEVTTGTFMVEVEGEDHYEPGAEERMVGVDLRKGVIFEVQITTGKTCAKHTLEDISSVDILKLGGAFCVDIRDVYTKEWRRHRSAFSDGAVSTHTKDYRQVARYRMRSMEDAAELFALLYKFITERSTREITPRVVRDESLPGIFSGNPAEWKNPLRIQQDILHRFFEEFLLEPASNIPLRDQTPEELESRSSDGPPTRKVQTIFQTLHDEFVDVGCLKHDRSGPSPEMVRLVLWSGCLPYVCPDRELPVCLLMTNVNIYLFYSSHFDSCGNPHLLKTANDLRQVLHCFYSFCVRELNEVAFGLFDQKFRMEVKQDGSRGTFTILTRDAEKTDKFLGTLRDVLGELPSQGDSICGPRISRQFSSRNLPAITFPDEEKINKLKDELAKSGKIVSPKDGQHLLMYAIVREVSDWTALNVQESGDLTNMLRSLIVTDSVIFLCDEDHVHWPLPSFVRSPPSTPQWVVTKSRQISRIIGIDVFELGGMVCELVGVFGLSLIFEREELDATSSDDQYSWHLIFRAADERTQLQRSLSQVWKDHFQADLKITSSKPKSFQGPYNNHALSSGNESISPTLGQSPASTPQNQKLKKTHRRVGSDTLPIFKPTMLNSLESLVALDRKVLDTFFHKWISQNDGVQDETLLHVLWTGCTPYLRPSLEIKVCVLLSNLFLYILADKEHKISINKKKGIKLMNSNGSKDSKPAICFNFIPITNLRQVCVGLFDQTLRLETESKEDTFTFITRDFNLTSAFLERLNAVLSSEHRETSPDSSSEALSESIYDSSSISDTDLHPKAEYQHTQSGVRFVYPNDETLEFLKDAISESSVQSSSCSRLQDVTILVYLLVFHETEPGKEEPRTLVIMDTSLCLCIEDHVNYPLPLFATGLPNNPQYEVQDLRDIESLSRVEFSDFNSCDFSMVFAPTRFRDEDVPEGFDSASMGELCVITHYKPDPDYKDVCWKIVAQTYEEKEKALGLICKLWADIHGGALPVMKAKN